MTAVEALQNTGWGPTLPLPRSFQMAQPPSERSSSSRPSWANSIPWVEQQASFCRSQIAKMKHLVAAPKVMEIREVGRQRFPNMVSGNKLLENERYTPMALPEYFTARVTTTLDGCTDPDVVHEVQDSSLPRIDVYGKLQRED